MKKDALGQITGPAERGESAPCAVVLGASGVLGGATVRALAARGFDIFGVHLDLAEREAHLEQLGRAVRAEGRRLHLLNGNVESKATITEGIELLRSGDVAPAGVRVLVHAVAFGTLLPFVKAVGVQAGQAGQDEIAPRQLQSTLGVMAHSLVYWVQALVAAELMPAGAKVLALTSIGSTRAMPSYGAISAAKACLEAHVRQLALELAPRGISVNAVRAGVVDSPALRQIPGSAAIIERARTYNPHHRLTTADDVGRAIGDLAAGAFDWMTGTVVGIDGGENVTL